MRLHITDEDRLNCSSYMSNSNCLLATAVMRQLKVEHVSAGGYHVNILTNPYHKDGEIKKTFFLSKEDGSKIESAYKDIGILGENRTNDFRSFSVTLKEKQNEGQLKTIPQYVTL